MAPVLHPGSGYGDILAGHNVAGMMLRDSFYSPNCETPNHAHSYAYFSMVLRGGYTEIYKAGPKIYRPAGLAFYPAGEVHRTVFHNSGARLFSIEINPSWLGQLGVPSPAFHRPFESSNGVMTKLALNVYSEFCQMEDDEVSALAIEGLMLEMVAESVRSSRPPRVKVPYWLVQARYVIRQHSRERLTVARIAESVGVHPVHLSRAFRRYYRCSIGDHVRRLRMEYACHQLAATDTPIVDIALSAGFCAQSYFSTTFKNHIGLTPHDYRASFRPR